MFKALISLEGLGRQYDPEFRLVDRVRPFLDRALSERYQPVMALRRSQATIWRTPLVFSPLCRVTSPAWSKMRVAAAWGSTSISSDSIASDDRNHDGVARHRFIDRHDCWGRTHLVRRSRANLWLAYLATSSHSLTALDHPRDLAFGPMTQAYADFVPAATSPSASAATSCNFPTSSVNSVLALEVPMKRAPSSMTILSW
jgi:hypothetical protein